MVDALDPRRAFIPTVRDDQPDWMNEYFRRIKQQFDVNRNQYTFEPLHAEPERKWDGLFVNADGVDWNPGRGRGIYYYDSTFGGEWVFVGGGVSTFDVSLGLVANRHSVNKFGFTDNADSGVDTDVWDGAANGSVTWVAPTAARIHDIVSTSASDDGAPVGAGARTIQVYGLTDWDTAEVSEVITLNGTTNVPTANSYVIIHRMKVLTKGATNVNVGNISATAQTDGTVTAYILAGEGQTQMAVYGIPTGSKLVVFDYYASVVKKTPSSSIESVVKLLFNPDPKTDLLNFATKHVNIVNSDFNLQHIFEPPNAFSGPGILKVEVNTDTMNAEVAAGFDAVLVDAAGLP